MLFTSSKSHQVNPEMENDYCVFIVNYFYCFMYRNGVNFMKITTEFTNFGWEFCLVNKPKQSFNSPFPKTTWVGRYQKDKPFLAWTWYSEQ